MDRPSLSHLTSPLSRSLTHSLSSSLPLSFSLAFITLYNNRGLFTELLVDQVSIAHI